MRSGGLLGGSLASIGGLRQWGSFSGNGGSGGREEVVSSFLNMMRYTYIGYDFISQSLARSRRGIKSRKSLFAGINGESPVHTS